MNSESSAGPSRINEFLLKNTIKIKDNPAISPDMTLDFSEIVRMVESQQDLLKDLSEPGAAPEVARLLSGLILWPQSEFVVAGESFFLVESAQSGDCALLSPGTLPLPFTDAIVVDGNLRLIPLYWNNFIALKNFVLEDDPESTIFPRATGALASSSLGIGARFTTLHWPAVAWAMGQIGLSITANQNSVPRELVFDVDAMMDNRLADVPFPFIGRSVPEGHQGQSVQGMSHASVITYLKYGFHHKRIPWGFNADHQPIGGKFDRIEHELVEGCLFASYITFDLSPELSATKLIDDPQELERAFEGGVDKEMYARTLDRVRKERPDIAERQVKRLVTYLAPAMEKMKRRDALYMEVRRKNFTSDAGRKFFRELSIDELPGQTTPETLLVCLAMAESMELYVQFVAPNFGFQKNFPYENNEELRTKIAALYEIASAFGVSIGFHSGSGKSAENYAVCGQVTEGNLEIKTSGRYTYEMGVALANSSDQGDQRLWNDWYAFTRALALEGAFANNEVQRSFAREFIDRALAHAGKNDTGVFESRETLGEALEELAPSPDHMFWFEYNFLFVLAADGSTERLGDHSPAGYEQRKRFYTISDTGRLNFARQVAAYVLFLAEATGLGDRKKIAAARARLAAYESYQTLLEEIC